MTKLKLGIPLRKILHGNGRNNYVKKKKLIDYLKIILWIIDTRIYSLTNFIHVELKKLTTKIKCTYIIHPRTFIYIVRTTYNIRLTCFLNYRCYHSNMRILTIDNFIIRARISVRFAMKSELFVCQIRPRFGLFSY